MNQSPLGTRLASLAILLAILALIPAFIGLYRASWVYDYEHHEHPHRIAHIIPPVTAEPRMGGGTVPLPSQSELLHVYNHHRWCGSTGDTFETWAHGTVRMAFLNCTITGTWKVNRNQGVTPQPTLQPTSTPTSSAPPDVAYIVDLMNRERQGYGVPPLLYDATQSGCSLAHSEHMAADGTISHNDFPYPSFNCSPGWTAIGQNVGESSGSGTQALLTIHQLMMSEPHSPGCASNHACAIISATYRRVGIGIYVSGGSTFLTEDFLAP